MQAPLVGKDRYNIRLNRQVIVFIDNETLNVISNRAGILSPTVTASTAGDVSPQRKKHEGASMGLPDATGCPDTKTPKASIMEAGDRLV